MVEPSVDNLKKVGSLIGRGIGSNSYVYLLGELDPSERERAVLLLAQHCGENWSFVRSLQQKHLSFISLNHDLFTLGAGVRYARLTRQPFDDRTAAKSLLSILKLLNATPLLLVQNDARAKSVADELCRVPLRVTSMSRSTKRRAAP